jgi:hypothetical protein
LTNSSILDKTTELAYILYAMESSSFTASKITGARGRHVVVDNIVVMRPTLKPIENKAFTGHKKMGYPKLAGFRQKPSCYFISSQNRRKRGQDCPFNDENTPELSNNFPRLKTKMGLK